MNRLFEESKAVIIREIEKGVKIFDKGKPICLATDWSKDGIRFFCSRSTAHAPTLYHSVA